jgi:hypothetical protein
VSPGGRGGWRGPAAVSAVAVLVAVGLSVWLIARPSGHHRESFAVTTANSTSVTSSTTTTTTSPATTVPPPATPLPARPAPSGEQFGASVNLLFNDQDSSSATIGRQLAALRSTGATLARSDALWEASEPVPPSATTRRFDWSFDDEIAGELAAHGLSWLPILDYSVSWAQSIPGVDHSPPRSDADYAAYAQAFAARYGTGGSFWQTHRSLPALPVTTIEIWNEPDNPEFWRPTPSASGYADLYIAARNAIDTVDPSARVIVGGLTDATQFLPAMLSARPDLRGHLDGVAIHPYGTPPVLRDRIVAARRTLDALGLGSTPLYVTEFGWTAAPPGAPDYASPATRPRDISQALATLSSLNCGIAAGLIYTWYSPESDPANSQDWFGIDSLGGRPTADTVAFAAGLRAAAAPSSHTAACTP